MKLSFSNPCRSFDATRNRVCFWAYDSAIEILFFVEVDALRRLCPDMSNAEEGYLQAFDSVRARIYEVADKVYGSGGRGIFTYSLAAKDF